MNSEQNVTPAGAGQNDPSKHISMELLANGAKVTGMTLDGTRLILTIEAELAESQIKAPQSAATIVQPRPQDKTDAFLGGLAAVPDAPLPPVNAPDPAPPATSTPRVANPMPVPPMSLADTQIVQQPFQTEMAPEPAAFAPEPVEFPGMESPVSLGLPPSSAAAVPPAPAVAPIDDGIPSLSLGFDSSEGGSDALRPLPPEPTVGMSLSPDTAVAPSLDHKAEFIAEESSQTISLGLDDISGALTSDPFADGLSANEATLPEQQKAATISLDTDSPFAVSENKPELAAPALSPESETATISLDTDPAFAIPESKPEPAAPAFPAASEAATISLDTDPPFAIPTSKPEPAAPAFPAASEAATISLDTDPPFAIPTSKPEPAASALPAASEAATISLDTDPPFAVPENKPGPAAPPVEPSISLGFGDDLDSAGGSLMSPEMEPSPAPQPDINPEIGISLGSDTSDAGNMQLGFGDMPSLGGASASADTGGGPTLEMGGLGDSSLFLGDAPPQPSLTDDGPAITETWNPGLAGLQTAAQGESRIAADFGEMPNIGLSPAPSPLMDSGTDLEMPASLEESNALGGERHGEPQPAMSFGLDAPEPIGDSSTSAAMSSPALAPALPPPPPPPPPTPEPVEKTGRGWDVEPKTPPAELKKPQSEAKPAEEKKPNEAGGTTVLIRYTCPKCKTQGMQAVDKVGTVVNCSNCGKAMRLVMKK